MGQIGQFIFNHWLLWAGLVFVLVLILVNELQAQKMGAKSLSPRAAVDLINHQDAVVIDLRDAESYRKGHIIDSMRASKDDFQEQRMDKYKDKPLILVCSKGNQSLELATLLKHQGFVKPFVLEGGLVAWQNAELPLIKGK